MCDACMYVCVWYDVCGVVCVCACVCVCVCVYGVCVCVLVEGCITHFVITCLWMCH